MLRYRFALLLLCSGAMLALELLRHPAVPEPARAVWPVETVAPQGTTWVVAAQGRIPMPPAAPAAHASNLLALSAEQPWAMLAFWFAGSRESGPDVRIAASAFERASRQWLPARWVVQRETAAAQLGFGIRRLGNPVAWRDGRGRLHLFVVATGLGGWAAGRILHLRQTGSGDAWEQLAFEPQRVLPLSWLWNTSHLVRAMPLPLADGGMALPVYFELGIKYPLVLRFDAQGEYRGMARMSSRRDRLQPTLLARGEQDWLALLRDSGPTRRLHAARTADGGHDWRDLADPDLHNPDAAVAALALRPQQMLLAHNPRPDTRAVLDLSASTDGLHWRRLLTLAEGDAGAEYSYPALAWADGSLWVSYTEQRRAIAWQRLTPSGPEH